MNAKDRKLIHEALCYYDLYGPKREPEETKHLAGLVASFDDRPNDDIEDLRDEARGLFKAFKQGDPAASRDNVVSCLNTLLDAVVEASETKGVGKAGEDDVLLMARGEALRVGSGAHSIKPIQIEEGNIEWVF